jgi:hypothetical protein
MLFDFVKGGKTMLVQHSDEVKTANAPYPLKFSTGNGRKCSSSVSAPNHPVLNYPNKITSTDFEDQEQGLYYQMNLIKPSPYFVVT